MRLDIVREVFRKELRETMRDRRSLGDSPGRRGTGWGGRRRCRLDRNHALADLVGGPALPGAVRTRARDRTPDLVHRRLVGLEQREDTLSAGKRPPRDGPAVRLAQGLVRCHEPSLPPRSQTLKRNSTTSPSAMT